MTVDVPFDAALPQRSVMLDRNGKSYAVLFAENRVPLTRSQISPKFVDALLSIEDDRFYTHGGVDLIGTTRAIGNNLLGGRRQGASTITQQWIKNLLLAAADTPEAAGGRRRRQH
jgi:membrane peptidoglycan carboxypeptidase